MIQIFNKLSLVYNVSSWFGIVNWAKLKFGLKVTREAKSVIEILEWAFKSKTSIKSVSGIIQIVNKTDNLSLDFFLRIRSSDALVFKQIILLKELEPAFLYFKNKNVSPKLMLDGGGNIGFSSRYMLALFPDLKSLIIEPNKGNAEMIRKNLPQNRYSLLEQAIWFENGIVFPDQEKNKGESEWGFSVHASKVQEEDEEGGIKANTIESILENCGFGIPDYLKLDIEGAEEVVFKRDLNLFSILKKVSCFSVEAHSCEFEVELKFILRELGFRVEKSGELIFGFRDE
ncbi:MAG: FkbM family methyltransferase [Algoriphagus sp.]|uniref:FkbM family methyltransferase n=1 Tax=Algoriphagus sp. TaxID=1872435 RepID=UPI002733DB86|nr:FkbM family methyltransferase [Algoriphagus sp.]MDP3200383.1 FkbM family methyltransferase [Algoriphagus sp.]